MAEVKLRKKDPKHFNSGFSVQIHKENNHKSVPEFFFLNLRFFLKNCALDYVMSITCEIEMCGNI